MDLFPVGSFVRLRNRARDKYVCADEDRIHVRLRSLRAARSLNAAWRVDILPVDGGGDHLLLQGVAYGRYLAVAHQDEVVPHGYSGVRAVQRHRLPHGDPPLMWTAVRVEADQNYVRLHNNEDRCLRANGRYCLWNKLVTVDVRNGDETTMMQWRVEAIPLNLEQIPLPPPPPSPPRVSSPSLLLSPFNSLAPRVHPSNGIWGGGILLLTTTMNSRTEVARPEHDVNITLGVRAGYNTRVIPLVTNLSNNADHMQIVV